jgi:chromosome segregation ATPase
MSASTRVQILTDKSAELSVLAEFLKNPNLITELAAEVKSLNSLTAAEEDKLAQARKDLKDHAEKVAELKKASDQLEADKAAHADHVNAVSEKLEQQSANLRDATLKQLETQNAQDATAKAQAEEAKKLHAHSAGMDKFYDGIEETLAKREALVAAREAANEELAGKLNAQARKQKETADKMKALAAD